MKKTIAMMLFGLLLCPMSACTRGGAVQQTETETGPFTENSSQDFVWSREGYFKDEEDNFLSVTRSDDTEYPGWYVGCMLGEDMYGWYIEQEGDTLHGNLVADYLDEDAFVVTVSEEGEDGLMLTVEDGTVYHFTPMEIEEASITVYINTEGFGQIATAKEGEALEFDEEYPSQSSYLGLAEPETYVFGAKPDEGWKFLKWTKNGEDYATDSQITVELTESAEYIAVFGIAGSDETPVDLESVTTLGELLGLPDYGSAAYEDTYVYAFEQDGIFYRAIAQSSPEVLDEIFQLDWEDADYDTKKNELISSLEVLQIENLSEMIPDQSELDNWIGKTGQELFDEGWTNSGWNLDTMEFYMDYGPFAYIVTFDGSVENYEDFEEEDMNPLVVTSVLYDGLGDATNIEEE
ncbi:MAG: hypothetical protein IJV50_04195 [Lachnospiraceae bacterium]|nr:hypothetical protein [Lachnospiraceae bacterium]